MPLSTSSKLNKITVSEALYYAAFALYNFSYALGITTFEEFIFIPVATWMKLANVATFLLLVVKFITQRAKFSGWVFAAAVVLVGYVSSRQSGENWLFWLALFVVCAEGVRLLPLARIVFVISFATFVLAVSFSYIGVIQDVVLSRANGSARHSLGFSHPNTAGKQLLVICTTVSVLRFGKSPWPDILLIVLADILNITLIDSRTAVILSFVQIAFLLVFYYAKKEKTRDKILAGLVAAMVLMVCVSLFIMVNYDASSGIYQLLDNLLSYRPYYQNAYYSMQGIMLFGCSYENFAPIAWGTTGAAVTFLVDNAWSHLILRYGIVPTSIFFVGLAALLRKILVERRWDALAFGLFLTLTFGLMETSGIQFECNYFLYALGAEVLYGAKGFMKSDTENAVKAETA